MVIFYFIIIIILNIFLTISYDKTLQIGSNYSHNLQGKKMLID